MVSNLTHPSFLMTGLAILVCIMKSGILSKLLWCGCYVCCQGESGTRDLDKPGNDFERGQADKFVLKMVDLGESDWLCLDSLKHIRPLGTA